MFLARKYAPRIEFIAQSIVALTPSLRLMFLHAIHVCLKTSFDPQAAIEINLGFFLKIIVPDFTDIRFVGC